MSPLAGTTADRRSGRKAGPIPAAGLLPLVPRPEHQHRGGQHMSGEQRRGGVCRRLSTHSRPIVDRRRIKRDIRLVRRHHESPVLPLVEQLLPGDAGRGLDRRRRIRHLEHDGVRRERFRCVVRGVLRPEAPHDLPRLEPPPAAGRVPRGALDHSCPVPAGEGGGLLRRSERDEWKQLRAATSECRRAAAGRVESAGCIPTGENGHDDVSDHLGEPDLREPGDHPFGDGQRCRPWWIPHLLRQWIDCSGLRGRSARTRRKFETSSLSVGANQIVVDYSGDAIAGSSVSPPADVVVTSTSEQGGPPAIPGPGQAYLGAWVRPNVTHTVLPPHAAILEELQELTSFNAGLERPLSIVHMYQSWANAVSTRELQQVLADGAIPMIDWRCGDSDANIIAGTDDALISAEAQELASLKAPIFLRWYYEPNFTGSANYAACIGNLGPAGYVAAFRHVHDLFAAAGASNVAFVFSMASSGNDQDLDQYYPGSSYVDWIAVDGYSKTTAPVSSDVVDRFGPWYSDFAAFGKPMMISETGSLAGGQANYFQQIEEPAFVCWELPADQGSLVFRRAGPRRTLDLSARLVGTGSVQEPVGELHVSAFTAGVDVGGHCLSSFREGRTPRRSSKRKLSNTDLGGSLSFSVDGLPLPECQSLPIGSSVPVQHHEPACGGQRDLGGLQRRRRVRGVIGHHRQPGDLGSPATGSKGSAAGSGTLRETTGSRAHGRVRVSALLGTAGYWGIPGAGVSRTPRGAVHLPAHAELAGSCRLTTALRWLPTWTPSSGPGPSWRWWRRSGVGPGGRHPPPPPRLLHGVHLGAGPPETKAGGEGSPGSSALSEPDLTPLHHDRDHRRRKSQRYSHDDGHEGRKGAGHERFAHERELRWRLGRSQTTCRNVIPVDFTSRGVRSPSLSVARRGDPRSDLHDQLCDGWRSVVSRRRERRRRSTI